MGLELGPLTRISPRQPNLVDVCDSSNELAKNRSSVLGRFEAKLSLLVLWGLTHKKARVTYITLDDLEMDRSRIRGRRSAVLENALNRKLSSVEPISQMKRRLGYFADWDYEPNRKGLLWVVAELGQWLSINDWELHLFGPGTLEKEQPAWITVHGFIEDLPSAYGSVDLTIAPDFWGAGYKNKVGESLLAARPVLTTPIGIRGQSSHQGIYLFTDRQSALSQLEQISNSDEIAAASRGLRISSLKINQDDERYLLLRKSLGLESVHNGQ
jgi:hypothetical protein